MGKAKIIAEYATKFIKKNRKKIKTKNKGEYLFLKLRARINGKLEYKTMVLNGRGKAIDLKTIENDLSSLIDDRLGRYEEGNEVGEWKLWGMNYERHEKTRVSKPFRKVRRKKKKRRSVRRRDK